MSLQDDLAALHHHVDLSGAMPVLSRIITGLHARIDALEQGHKDAAETPQVVTPASEEELSRILHSDTQPPPNPDQPAPLGSDPATWTPPNLPQQDEAPPQDKPPEEPHHHQAQVQEQAEEEPAYDSTVSPADPNFGAKS